MKVIMKQYFDCGTGKLIGKESPELTDDSNVPPGATVYVPKEPLTLTRPQWQTVVGALVGTDNEEFATELQGMLNGSQEADFTVMLGIGERDFVVGLIR